MYPLLFSLLPPWTNRCSFHFVCLVYNCVCVATVCVLCENQPWLLDRLFHFVCFGYNCVCIVRKSAVVAGPDCLHLCASLVGGAAVLHRVRSLRVRVRVWQQPGGRDRSVKPGFSSPPIIRTPSYTVKGCERCTSSEFGPPRLFCTFYKKQKQKRTPADS